jgi:hypothetical protein
MYRRLLDGEKYRVVLELRKLTGQRLSMTRAKVLAEPKQIVARGVCQLDVDHGAVEADARLSACVRVRLDQVLGTELLRDVGEVVPRAIVGGGPLAQEEKRVERLQLLLELADALKGLFVGGGLPDCHDPRLAHERRVVDLGRMLAVLSRDEDRDALRTVQRMIELGPDISCGFRRGIDI